jgi:hypothetical protein
VREADKLLRDEIQAVEQRREWARGARNDAVREVLRTSSETAALWQRFQNARQRVRDLSWELAAARIFIGPPFHWDGRLEDREDGRGDKWKSAIKALENDPGAVLPVE